MINVQQ